MITAEVSLGFFIFGILGYSGDVSHPEPYFGLLANILPMGNIFMFAILVGKPLWPCYWGIARFSGMLKMLYLKMHIGTLTLTPQNFSQAILIFALVTIFVKPFT